MKQGNQSIFNQSLNRAGEDEPQKQGSFYYDIFKEFQLIFDQLGLEGFDLESP